MVRGLRPRARQDGGPLEAGEVSARATSGVVRLVPGPAGGLGTRGDPGGLGRDGAGEGRRAASKWRKARAHRSRYSLYRP